ncbi:lipid IV(A) 3-deoxy-D-manno-octulosonic acid transferase [Halioxenophilus sp. WMMB6]|uniref:lipid IV(A) 3-deoxy-D-manno-octulosonic acid transferase n=1 Tax=Halioxenophilus sp. WMMB6 TaxID=3073815 RepID=UPI00295E73B5|nr:lipid IV(A) 3-deoxy-D-manno-octulosonic acid transferase [Halioxenophilus sp. WMMB6]
MLEKLYTGACYLALPWVWLRLKRRARLQPEYGQRLAERLGYYPGPAAEAANLVWLHTVSVGEFLAAQPLIEALLARGDLQLLITTTTPTGSAQVRERLGERVQHVYLPYDLPPAIHRFLDHFKPRLLLVMETELWPNLLRLCRKRGIDSVLVNGRLSARSARGYRRVAGLTRTMLSNLTLALMQYPADAERLRGLGMAPERVAVCGSIKFDLPVPAALKQQAQALRQSWPQAQVWIAASTHPGEEVMVLAALALLKAQQPDTLLILAPRHPERRVEIESLCADWQVAVRSEGDAVTAATDILLLDTLGELMLFYGAADIALVGGSLVEHGGHNLVEPAAWGKPVLSGPHRFNFASLAEAMAEAGGLLTVTNAAELAATLTELMSDSARAQMLGEQARQFAQSNRGALARILAAVAPMLPASTR